MRIGAFEVVEPLPQLREPHAVAMLRPWTDAGNVGALALLELERQFSARPCAALARPGSFYDFTRYRPTVYLRDGVRHLSVPNTVVSVATPPHGPHLVIIKMLEPHMFAETYVESMLTLLGSLGVRRYLWVGSMYDMVPHTRPLLVSGGAIGTETEADASRLGIVPTGYQGPSTMTFEVIQKAPMMGIESLWGIVHLPQYVQVEEDYAGKVRLMQLLQGLYDIEIDVSDVERALEQTETMDRLAADNPDLAQVVTHFEARYEGRLHGKEQKTPPCRPMWCSFLTSWVAIATGPAEGLCELQLRDRQLRTGVRGRHRPGATSEAWRVVCSPLLRFRAVRTIASPRGSECVPCCGLSRRTSPGCPELRA